MAVVFAVLHRVRGVLPLSAPDPLEPCSGWRPFRVAFSSSTTNPMEETMTAAETHAVHAANFLEGVKVLLVEDDEDSRELLIELLMRAGAVVQAADSAATAFRAFQSFRPQVLISD